MKHDTDWEGPTWGRRYFRRCKKGSYCNRDAPSYFLFLFPSPPPFIPRIRSHAHFEVNLFSFEDLNRLLLFVTLLLSSISLLEISVFSTGLKLNLCLVREL